MAEIDLDVFYDSGLSVRVGQWAAGPCYRCGRQPEPGEVLALDVMAQTVLCAECREGDYRRLAAALDAWAKRRGVRLNDGQVEG